MPTIRSCSNALTPTPLTSIARYHHVPRKRTPRLPAPDAAIAVIGASAVPVPQIPNSLPQLLIRSGATAAATARVAPTGTHQRYYYVSASASASRCRSPAPAPPPPPLCIRETVQTPRKNHRDISFSQLRADNTPTPKSAAHHPSRRHFSSSSPLRTSSTVPIHNAPSDPTHRLDITPRAAARLRQISQRDDNPNLALRIQVESGGCHGFQYLMSLVTLPGDFTTSPARRQQDAGDGGVVREDDSIFCFVDEEVDKTTSSGARIILDAPSLDLLKGSKVDFTQELIGSQFKIVENPLASSSCGCGTSFDIKLG